MDAFQAKIPENSRQGLPWTMAGRCSEDNLALMQDFFADRDELYQASLDRQVENAAHVSTLATTIKPH